MKNLSRNNYRTLLFLLGFSFVGCWSLIGPERVYVRRIPQEGLYGVWFWLALLLWVGSLGLRFWRASTNGPVLKEVKKVLRNTALSIAVSYTIVGTFVYWLLHKVLGWGTPAKVMLVILSVLGGLAPGAMSISGLVLFMLYHDTRLLYCTVIPGLVGDLLEAWFNVNRNAPVQQQAPIEGMPMA